MVAVAHGLGLEMRGVEPDIGFGDGEARLLLAADERRQKAPLLLLAAELHHRVQAEDVHVQRRCAAEPGARLGDRLHHGGGLADAEAGAAVFFGHGDAEPAVARDGGVELLGETALAVALEPIGVAEPGTEPLDGVADAAPLVAERSHGRPVMA